MKLLRTENILGKELNVYGEEREYYFLAKDVAEWIEYAKTGKGSYDVSRMLGTVDDEEKLVRTLFISGQNREMWFLTEDGLYEVLMQSRKPIAKEFKKQVKLLLKQYRLRNQLTLGEMFDKEHQKKAMDKVKELEGNYIITNKMVNKILGIVCGVDIEISKKAIKKYQDQTELDLLEVREWILDKFINAYEFTGSHKQAKEMTEKLVIKKYNLK